MVTRPLLVCVLLHCATAALLKSRGTKGSVCSKERQLTCPPEESRCEQGYCVCTSPGRYGVPGLQCTMADVPTCSLTNDPHVSTFSGDSVEHAVPCMALVAAGTAPIVRRSGTVGTCSFRVYSYNTRARGKMYQGGVRVIIDFHHNIDTRLDKHIGLAAEGIGYHGNYEYVTKASPNQVEWVSYEETSDDSLRILSRPFAFHLDRSTNRIILSYRDCGLTVNFRAADTYYGVRQQQHLPGLTVTVQNPDGLQGEGTLCQSPGVPLRSVVPDGMTDNAAFVVSTFTAQAPQDFTNASTVCSAMRDPILRCQQDHPNYRAIMNTCSKVFEHSGFMGCYSRHFPDGARGSGHSLLSLFELCVLSNCRNQLEVCTAIQDHFDLLPPACRAKVPIGSDEMCAAIQILGPSI